MKDRVKVVVTGAAGQISYSLIPRLVDGHTFGNKIDLIIENSIQKTNVASTILDLTIKPAIIIREGFIPKKIIQNFIDIQ